MNNKYIPTHPLQSLEWGEFRKKTGIKVIQENRLQLTIHKIPHTPWTIGYLPKGPLPTKEMIHTLEKIGKQEKCVFIQLEPNVILRCHSELVSESRPVEKEMLKLVQHDNVKPSFHPLFTKYTFILDLTKSENDLLKAMYPKTRYNIKVAQKHGVKVVEDNSDEAFETYLKLMAETTKRQNFYAHDEKYHRLMWETLGVKNQESSIRRPKLMPKGIKNQGERKKNIIHDSYFMIHNSNKLTAHLLLANYKPITNHPLRSEASQSLATNHQSPITLASWILFVYKDTLYYPYGASSNEHRETMASNLMMWEAIKFGKKLGLKKFDMWGALGHNPSKNDPWYGFHRFKEGYGGKLVEFVESHDLIINPFLYQLYKIADKIRWLHLKLKL